MRYLVISDATPNVVSEYHYTRVQLLKKWLGAHLIAWGMMLLPTNVRVTHHVCHPRA